MTTMDDDLHTTINDVTEYFTNPDPPEAWHLCDGSQFHRDDYPELYRQMTHLPAQEGGLFNLPDYTLTVAAVVGSYIKVKRSLFGNYEPIGYITSIHFPAGVPLPKWYDPHQKG